MFEDVSLSEICQLSDSSACPTLHVVELSEVLSCYAGVIVRMSSHCLQNSLMVCAIFTLWQQTHPGLHWRDCFWPTDCFGIIGWKMDNWRLKKASRSGQVELVSFDSSSRKGKTLISNPQLPGADSSTVWRPWVNGHTWTSSSHVPVMWPIAGQMMSISGGKVVMYEDSWTTKPLLPH